MAPLNFERLKAVLVGSPLPTSAHAEERLSTAASGPWASTNSLGLPLSAAPWLPDDIKRATSEATRTVGCEQTSPGFIHNVTQLLPSMSCPKCGCRMVSRQATNLAQLICSDCSHPMTAHLRSLNPRRSWGDLGAVALVLAIGCSALGLTTVKTLLSSGQGEIAPATAEQHRKEN